MNHVLEAPRRVLGIGLAWASLWLAFWTVVVAVIGFVDPDSIDPGEGLMFLIIFGPMGLLSGIVFGIFLRMGGRGQITIDRSPVRIAGWGILGTAIVQTAYLGHGDQGLTANIKMALLFSGVGGLVTMVWLVMARRWSHWRSSPQPSS